MNDRDPGTGPSSTPLGRADREATFDAFYKSTRDRLLLQAYALTGDLPAARHAVRDAFVVAWHHWRKLGRLESPESEVRPPALRNAARRATVRPWHREKSLDDDTRATLEALASLSATQRRALVLTQLAAVSMTEMAAEIGLPLEAAERELQLGASRFSTERGVPASSIPVLFADLGRTTGPVTWPRVTIIRRAGAARRRGHTLVGVVAASATLLGAGYVVSDPTGMRPTLAREAPTGAPTVPSAPAPEISLPDTALVSDSQLVTSLGGDGWDVTRTDDHSTGSPVAHFCQVDESDRYADPRGAAAWVRVLKESGTDEPRGITQTAEASASAGAAKRAFRTARSWFAGCSAPRAYLVSTFTGAGLGDESAVFLVRDVANERTYVSGVARSGLLTTVVTLRTLAVPANVDLDGFAGLLADAVSELCALPDGGGCARTPARLEEVPPFPAGAVPAMLSELDLPTVAEEPWRWVAPEAKEITPATAAIGVVGCSSVTFTGTFQEAGFKSALVRSWVLPESDLPTEVGLDQTVAALPERAAAELVTLVRDQVNACPDKNAGAGTEVDELASFDRGPVSYTAWRLSTRLPDDDVVGYNMAIIRVGTAISQLAYVAAPRAPMDDAAWVALTERASQRLAALPAYRR